MEESLTESLSPLESELYFLIAKFLAGGPCQEAAKVIHNNNNQPQKLSTNVNKCLFSISVDPLTWFSGWVILKVNSSFPFF